MKKNYDINFKYTYQCAKKVLDELMKEKENKYVVYPNGEIARFVKDLLREEYGVNAEYAIDNQKFDGKDVLNRVDFEVKDREIRRRIYETFDEKQIFDLFPENKLKKLPSNEEIHEVLVKLDKYYR